MDNTCELYLDLSKSDIFLLEISLLLSGRGSFFIAVSFIKTCSVLTTTISFLWQDLRVFNAIFGVSVQLQSIIYNLWKASDAEFRHEDKRSHIYSSVY